MTRLARGGRRATAIRAERGKGGRDWSFGGVDGAGQDGPQDGGFGHGADSLGHRGGAPRRGGKAGMREGGKEQAATVVDWSWSCLATSALMRGMRAADGRPRAGKGCGPVLIFHVFRYLTE